MRMLVTGAAGAVGSYIPSVFHDFELVLTDLAGCDVPLDVRDLVAVRKMIVDQRPDIVLHLAAATDVDACAKDSAWAHESNAIGTHHVATACQASNATLVYVSTAAVFRGDKPEPYTELDEPDPVIAYGKSKYEGEQAVQSILTKYFTVRAGWIFGGVTKDKKFVAMMIRKILSRDTPLQVVNDRFGSPTYARDLLEGIRKLVKTESYSVYHMVNTGTCSRFGIAQEIVRILDTKDVGVVPVSSSFFPSLATRIPSEMLRNSKLDHQGLNWMRPWQAALREYVMEEFCREKQHAKS